MALGCPTETPGDVASKGPFVLLEFGKAFEGEGPGVLNKVYACGNTDQPFTFSGVECKALASGAIALRTLSLRCAADTPRCLSHRNRIVHGSDPACVFLISSEYLARR